MERVFEKVNLNVWWTGKFFAKAVGVGTEFLEWSRIVNPQLSWTVYRACE